MFWGRSNVNVCPATIRKACPGDAPGMAAVHVSAWRDTYRGVIDDAVLDGLSEERSEMRLRERIDSSSVICMVAENDRGQVVGFACGGPERSDEHNVDVEIYAIYILRQYQRQGVGRRLVKALAGEFAGRQYASMLIWVLSGNSSAATFYENLRGEVFTTKPLVIGNCEYEVTGYVWRNLGVIIENGRSN